MAFSSLDSGLTGPLFATHEMRTVFTDRNWIEAMLSVETALAEAQAHSGLVPEKLSLILGGIDAADFDPAALGEATAISGVPTIPFLKALRDKLPADCAPYLHRGATTQDLWDSATILLIRQGITLLLAQARAVVIDLVALAEKHRLTPCAGRSYDQHAAPVTFGYKAGLWALGLAETLSLWPTLEPRVLQASLSGPVGTFAGMGDKATAVQADFAARLGLMPSLAPWHNRRAGIVQLASWLATVLAVLAKMAGDIAHLASTEIGEVAEPYQPGRGGSSAMPHKRNPVSATLIVAAAQASRGLLPGLFDAMANARHERPAGAWHGEWHLLPILFGLTSGALREAASLAKGLTLDTERMQANLDMTRGLLFADALAARLAPAIGAQAAHDKVAALADAVRRTGCSLHDLAMEDDALQAQIGREAVQTVFSLNTAREAAARSTTVSLSETARHLALLDDA
jgi:3-carboxy-cis,cis-muconate cycloisomerase